MSAVLLDTHAWAWSLTASQRLSGSALSAIQTADAVSVSAISFYEIGQKVRLGKWPEMVGHTVRLEAIAEEQGVTVIDMSSEIGLLAATLPWDHRDPFDRIILATAVACRMPLVSADAVFDDLLLAETWSRRIW